MAAAVPVVPPEKAGTPQVAATSNAAPKKKSMVHHLVAGGFAGFVETSCW